MGAVGAEGRHGHLAKGRDLLRDAILAGRGAVLFTELGTPELHCYHQFAAASGRIGEIQVLDLSGDTRAQGGLGRRFRVVPDLDALVGTRFAEDVLTALASSTAIQEFPLPTPVPEPQSQRAAVLARALAAEPMGSGAWDRVMARVALEPLPRHPVPTAARAGRAALLRSDIWPGLDGVTPLLDLRRALANGLTLVLLGGSDERRTPSSIDRRHVAGLALGTLFAEGVRPGGACVIMSRWASKVFAYDRERIERPAPEGAVPPTPLANESLSVLPGGSPASRQPRSDPSGEPFGTATGLRRDGGARFLLVDPEGWPTFLQGPAPGDRDVAAAARDLARGAVATGMPFGFSLALTEFTPWGFRACLGGHPLLPGPPWPDRSAPPMAGIDRELVLACEDAGAGSLLHAWARTGDSRRRRQFVLAWRGLADLGRIHDLGAAIDAGVPSLPLIARILGLDTTRTRRFVGLPVHLGDDAPTIQAISGRMRVDRLPPAGDAHAWMAFRRAAKVISELVPGIVASGPPASAFLDRCGRNRWMEAESEVPDNRGLNDTLFGLCRLCAEATGTEDNYDVALSMLLDASDMRMLLSVERAWHAEPVLRRGSSLDLAPDTAWPTLFEGDVGLGDGVVARGLGSLADLIDEGATGLDTRGRRGLDHCVASYARACLSGECAIVSLREADGGRLSTAEMLMLPTGPSVVQHRAVGNAEPDARAKAALARLVERLRSGDVPSRPGFSGADPRLREDEEEPLDPETRRAVLDDLSRRWSRILPPAWRHPDFAELARAIRERAESLGIPVGDAPSAP